MYLLTENLKINSANGSIKLKSSDHREEPIIELGYWKDELTAEENLINTVQTVQISFCDLQHVTFVNTFNNIFLLPFISLSNIDLQLSHFNILFDPKSFFSIPQLPHV